MEIKALIFDLDGVLVSTDQYHYQAWSSVAKRLHIPFSETINNRLRGVSRRKSLEIILEGYAGEPLTAEEKEALADEKDVYKRQGSISTTAGQSMPLSRYRTVRSTSSPPPRPEARRSS